MTESKAPAIARAAAILRLLGKSDTPMGVNTIARALGLVPSTCLYVLRALTEEGLVAFDPDTKRYTLDAGVLTLARGWLRRNRFADVVQGALDRLSREHNVTILAVQVTGLQHMVVVATSQGSANFQLSAHVGSRFPALISATGRCIAAFGGYTSGELERRFHTLRWDNPPTYAAWRDQVAETRREGYAIDRGHYIAGVTVIAAPVTDGRGRLSHALVAVGLASAMDRAGIQAIGEQLSAAARAASDRLDDA